MENYQQTAPQRRRGPRINVLKLLSKILFSPVILLIIAYIVFGDVRKSVLATLLIITAWNVLALVFDIFKLGLATLTLNFIGFIKTSIDILLAIVVILVYWFIYIAVYGFNLGF